MVAAKQVPDRSEVRPVASADAAPALLIHSSSRKDDTTSDANAHVPPPSLGNNRMTMDARSHTAVSTDITRSLDASMPAPRKLRARDAVPPNIVIPPLPLHFTDVNVNISALAADKLSTIPSTSMSSSTSSELAISPSISFSVSPFGTSSSSSSSGRFDLSTAHNKVHAHRHTESLDASDALQFASRYPLPLASDLWASFDAAAAPSPPSLHAPFPPPPPPQSSSQPLSLSASSFASLLHSPHYIDASCFHHQPSAAAAATQSMTALLAYPTEALAAFSVESATSTAPLGNGQQHEQQQALLYPPLSPIGGNSHASTSQLPSTDLNLSLFSLSDIVLLGSSSAGSTAVNDTDAPPPLLVQPHSSPTNVLYKPGALLSPTSSFVPLSSSSNNSGSGHGKDITLDVLRPHFNKPMAIVAKELGVCITLLKKICRRNGLARWPHRRIRSLVNRINALQEAAATTEAAGSSVATATATTTSTDAQLAALRLELSAVIQNPNEKSRKAHADAKSRSPLAPIAASSMLVQERSPHSSSTTSNQTIESPHSVPIKPTKREDSNKKKRKRADLEPSSSPPSILPTLQQAPPPIKIPRYCDFRGRRNSAPEQLHLSALHELTALALARPSTTTSAHRKRGSISSILCHPTE